MKSADKEVCLKELSHSVLDCNEKVTISSLAENWSLTLTDASSVLLKWVEQNENVKLKQQFLVRGVDKDGTPHLTVMPQPELETLNDRFPQHFKMLYSIEVASENEVIEKNNNLDFKSKRLQLNTSDLYRTKVKENQTSPAKVSSNELKRKTEEQLDSTEASTNKNIKKGEKQNSVVSMFKNVKTEPKSPKKIDMNKSHLSPQKKSPKKSPPSKTTVQNTKKGMIASFFTAKPTAVKSEIKEETSVEISEPVKNVKSEVENERKRSSLTSDTEEESKDIDKKKTKNNNNPSKRRKVEKTTKTRAKGSRILQVVDSSDEEENEVQEENTDKEVEENKVEDKTENGHNENGITKRKVKKHRMVTRTYEDEDGYIRTVKESEEYSSSEAEEVVPPTHLKEQNAPTPVKTPKKKEVKMKANTKQGSITSFFSKK